MQASTCGAQETFETHLGGSSLGSEARAAAAPERWGPNRSTCMLQEPK